MSKKLETNTTTTTTTTPKTNTPPTTTTPAATKTTEPETTDVPTTQDVPPAQEEPTPQGPTHAAKVIATTGPVANANNMIGPCDENYATLCGDGKVILLQSADIAIGSPITIYARGGGPNCRLYVYNSTSPAGPWILLAAQVINSEKWTEYISNTYTNGQYISLAVTGDACIDIDCVVST